jgi:hypothetical protein
MPSMRTCIRKVECWLSPSLVASEDVCHGLGGELLPVSARGLAIEWSLLCRSGSGGRVPGWCGILRGMPCWQCAQLTIMVDGVCGSARWSLKR